jgi:hypothetical protein
MAQPKYTLWKYVKLKDGSWRYKRAAFYSNGKIKPNVVIVGKDAKKKSIEETHPEGAYNLYHNRQWIPVGADALDAQRQRNARLDYDEFRRLHGTASTQSPTVLPITPRRTLSDAVEEFCQETKANKKHKTYLKGLVRNSNGSGHHGFHRHRNVSVIGDKYDRSVDSGVSQEALEVQAIDTRKSYVEDEATRPFRPLASKKLFGCLEGLRTQAQRFQQVLNGRAHPGIVIIQVPLIWWVA